MTASITTRAFALAIALAGAAITPAFAQMHDPLMFEGHQMMSADEMAEMMKRMQDARSDEECADIRREHHSMMKERAAGMGIELPDNPRWENMPEGCGHDIMMGGRAMRQDSDENGGEASGDSEKDAD